jgi:hypothetical protein
MCLGISFLNEDRKLAKASRNSRYAGFYCFASDQTPFVSEHNDTIFSTKLTFPFSAHPNCLTSCYDTVAAMSDSIHRDEPKRHIVRPTCKPKPDTNGPKKPLAAPVAFQREIREELQKQGSLLHGSEIFKLAGQRWSALPPEDKKARMEQTKIARNEYESAMNEYKKTAQYDEYQTYLADFQRQKAAATSGKSETNIFNPDFGDFKNPSYLYFSDDQ